MLGKFSGFVSTNVPREGPRVAGPAGTAMKSGLPATDLYPEFHASNNFRPNSEFENPTASSKCGRLHQDADVCIHVESGVSQRPPDDATSENVHTYPSTRTSSAPRPPLAGRPATIEVASSCVPAQDFLSLLAAGSPAWRVAAAIGKTHDHSMAPPLAGRPATIEVAISCVGAQDFPCLPAVGSPAVRVAAAVGEAQRHDTMTTFPCEFSTSTPAAEPAPQGRTKSV